MLRQEEGNRKRDKQPPVTVAGLVPTVYTLPVAFLDQQVMRDAALHDPSRGEQKPEKAEFEVPWVTAPGSPVFAAALLSMLLCA